MKLKAQKQGRLWGWLSQPLRAVVWERQCLCLCPAWLWAQADPLLVKAAPSEEEVTFE